MSSNGFIYWFGGAATTVVGSWISSKIRVYHDAKGKHHQELKQKVLEPIRDSLERSYRALFDDPTLGADATPDGYYYERTALATQDPVAIAVSLAFHDPARFTVPVEGALLQDSKANHHHKLIHAWEQFTASVTGHINRREIWIREMATFILDESGGLLPFAPNRSGDYVMHLKLATFVHGRLFETERVSLSSTPNAPNGRITLMLGSICAVNGTMFQVERIINAVEALRRREESRALQFQSEVKHFQQVLSNLCDQFSLAIAANKLYRRCALVSFL